MEQHATSIQTPEQKPVMSEFGYSYDLDFTVIPKKHREGVENTFSTMYKTMAALYEHMIMEHGVPEKMASQLLPRGLHVKFKIASSQTSFDFSLTNA